MSTTITQRRTSIDPDNRIRLVTFIATGSDGKTVPVNLRFDWSGATPEHSCVAGDCTSCDVRANRAAQRRLPEGVRVTSITVARDRQAERNRTTAQPEPKPAA